MKTKFATTALIIASGLIMSSMALAGDRSEQNRTARSYAASYTQRNAVTTTGGASGLTRDQVKAELAEAIRTGNIVTNGESGQKLNELYPSRYLAKQEQVGLTREQVNAELVAAVRSGDIMANGERSRKLNELYPNRYPAKQEQAGLTREQVKAELSAALKSGDYFLNGEIGGKCNEVHPSMHKTM